MELQLEFGDDVWELLALDGSELPVVLFNGPICTTAGLYRVSELATEHARLLVSRLGFISAVGHSGTAEVLSKVLDVEVPLNRIEYLQQAGQKAIALKLNVRAREGEILTREQIEEIGFSLQLLQRLE